MMAALDDLTAPCAKAYLLQAFHVLHFRTLAVPQIESIVKAICSIPRRAATFQRSSLSRAMGAWLSHER